MLPFLFPTKGLARGKWSAVHLPYVFLLGLQRHQNHMGFVDNTLPRENVPGRRIVPGQRHLIICIQLEGDATHSAPHNTVEPRNP